MNYCYSSIAVAAVFVLLIIPRVCSSSSLTAITPGQPLKDGDVLLSPRKTFALGFFSPAKNSSRRYVGMWYNTVPGQTVIWVANRDNPINDTSGVLAVDSAGGLILSAANRSSPVVWSANVSSLPTKGNAFVARLSDIGNFALFDDENSESIAWQSFDHPTDTWVPFMTLGPNRKKGLTRYISSWKSPEDPATGNVTLGIDTDGKPQLFLRRGRTPLWRGGAWTGLRWTGVPGMTRFIYNITYVENKDEVSLTDVIQDKTILSRMVVDGTGRTYRTMWHAEIGRWTEFWTFPKDSCDPYGLCGPYGYCDPAVADVGGCVCMPGFEPRAPREWLLREGSGGCVRKRVFGCSTNGSSGAVSGDGFAKLAMAKLPDTSEALVIGTGSVPLMLEDCAKECLKNCSCTAYATANESVGGTGCVMWYGDLMDTRLFSTAGQDLYLRVDAVTLSEYVKKSKRSGSIMLKLAIGLSSGVVLFLLFFVVWFAKKTRKAREEKKRFYSVKANTTLAFSEDFADKKDMGEDRTKSELPFFTLNAVALATENFSPQNKLGEGGFGSVYKGTLSDGKEVAVKRLSKYSGQGTEEFKNEVMLIANLQHRNLVKIIGCCVQGEEKMLIYEYLTNKSLDMFIFDDKKRRMLDWKTRFDIICGVARGLLYLHQDSRLRIIHRDLKASNVLLDGDMNPKIADFGLARRFGGDQNEANTNRVVGTYGYMSPEYAMEGRFSTKSDVYSFGVLLLEIITGRKNTSHFLENPDSNLVGYVWKLWKQDNSLELVDSPMDEPIASEALKSVQIGLLCVQEYANDRPSMSTVVFMLGNDVPVPTPKQPAFMSKRSCPAGHVWTTEGDESVNDVTCTSVVAR